MKKLQETRVKKPLNQKNRGFFVTLEGGEGSGKSSLAYRLEKFFSKKGIEVLLTREPGGCPFAEKLRSIVLGSEDEISDEAELLLFLSARAEHINKVIRPAIERGALVICDRFTDSTLCYQGYARGLGIDTILPVCKYAEGIFSPDRTYLLDLDPKEGFQRIKKRESSDRIEMAGSSFHQKVREGFLDLANRFPDRICTVDASMSIKFVFEKVMTDLSERL